MCHVCHRSFLEYSFSNWNGQRLRRFRILIAEFIFNCYCQNLALQSQLVSTLMCCSRPPSPSPVPRAFPLPISKGKDLGTRLPPPPHTHTPRPLWAHCPQCTIEPFISFDNLQPAALNIIQPILLTGNYPSFARYYFVWKIPYDMGFRLEILLYLLTFE